MYSKRHLTFFLLIIFNFNLNAQIKRFDESTCHLIHNDDHEHYQHLKNLPKLKYTPSIDFTDGKDLFTASNENNIVTSFLKPYGNEVWKFTKNSDKEISIEFTGVQFEVLYGPFGEIQVSVIKPDGTYLFEFSKLYSLNSGGEPRKLIIPGDSPNGEYKIEVSPYKNEKGGYKLGLIQDNSYITLTSHDFPRPTTYNGKINEAPNENEEWKVTKNSSFLMDDDVHSFSVELKKDENLKIDLYNVEPYVRGWWGGEDWSSMDTKLYLFDSEGNLVAKDDDSGNNKNARIYYTVLKEGTYNLIATNYGKYDENQWSTDVDVQHPDWELGSKGITYYTLDFESDSKLDFIYEEFSVSDPNSIMINAILLTNDELLTELPVTTSHIQDLIKSLNEEYNLLYDSNSWSSFELAGITKFYNPDFYKTESPHEALAQIGSGPASLKNYLNIIFLDCDEEKTGIVGTTNLYSSVLTGKGAVIVLDNEANAGVLIHEMGHVVGMNHTAGTWPPARHTLDLQNENKLGYLTAYISKAENSHMSNWSANPFNRDPGINIYLTEPKYTLATPTYGDHFKEGFRSWLINNEYIDSDAPGTGYEGNNIIGVSSNFKNLKEYNNVPRDQLWTRIASSSKSDNNLALLGFLDSYNSEFSYATRDKDNSWSDLIKYPGNISNAGVGMNDRGDAVVITEPWYAKGITAIYKAHDSENWNTPDSISSSSTYRYHLRSNFDINNGGNVAVVWLENHDFNYRIVSNEFVDGVWKGEKIISSSPNNKELPSIAYNDIGDMIITWQEWSIDNSERYDVVGKFRDSYTGNWSDLETYNDKSNQAGFSQVALDENGDALIYWRQEDGTFIPNAADNQTGKLMVRFRNKNGSLNNIQSLSPDGEDSFNASLEITKPRIVFKNGKAAVTWWGVNGGRNVIYASIMNSPNEWVMNRLTDSGKNAVLPSISMSDSLIGVSWQRTDGLNYRIQSRFYNLNTNSWSSLYTASEEGGDAIHSDITIDSDNTASLVWARYSSGKFTPQVKQFIQSSGNEDSDGDGVINDIDQCPDTPSGTSVDANGCADSQKDTDGDGVTDDIDQCPDTPSGTSVDANGCELPLFTENVTFVENIYPNPTDDRLSINVKPGVEVKDLHFNDLSGKAIKPKSIDRVQNRLEVNVSNLNEGIYILEIVTGKEVNKVKVIIER